MVGSGISGMSLAYLLAKKRLKVALIGPVELSELLGESTAGILTYHLREPFLSWALRTYEIYKEVKEDAIEKVETLWLINNDEFFKEVTSKASEHGLRVQEVSEKEVSEVTGGRVKVENGEIAALGDGLKYNVKKLHRAFIDKLSELEVDVISKWAELRDSRVLVDGEEIRGRAVVVASGPWTRELLNLRNLTIYKCQLSKIPQELHISVIDDVLGFYYNVLSEGIAALGDGIEVVVDDIVKAIEPDEDVLISVVNKAIKRGVLSKLPKDFKMVSAPCIGTSDGLPVVGKVGENLYVITGFNGIGYSVAPAVAEILVEHILYGKEIAVELSPNRELKEGKVIEPIDM